MAWKESLQVGPQSGRLGGECGREAATDSQEASRTCGEGGPHMVSVFSPSISGSAWWESGFAPHLLFAVTASSHTAHMLDSYFRYCDNSLNSHQRENDKPSPVALK